MTTAKVHRHVPFWGPPTAHSNFCEEDYQFSPYFGELVNTISNSAYVIGGCIGLWRQAADPDWTKRLGYYGLIAVGVFSAAFHCSLLYSTQMCDDTSMFLATAPVLHRLLSSAICPRYLESSTLGILIFTTLTAITAIHAATDELVLHPVTFALMLGIIAFLTTRELRLRNRRNQELQTTGTTKSSSSQKNKSKSKQKSTPKTSSTTTTTTPTTPPTTLSIKDAKSQALAGFLCIAFGFALWVPDCIPSSCAVILRWQAELGMPWVFILQLHAWWHILTAIGAYLYISLANDLV